MAVLARALLIFFVASCTGFGPDPARAEGLCDGLSLVLEKWPEVPASQPWQAGEGKTCRYLKELSGPLFLCQWDHDLQDPAAQAHFDRLSQDLEVCFGFGATMVSDQRVNHPDSYLLRQFEVREKVISLSLKDKSALGRTIVFLRVQAPDPK
ncbi:MAG: hypothetical protein AAF530_24355 [Pseudomonadota bacterium]